MEADLICFNEIFNEVGDLCFSSSNWFFMNSFPEDEIDSHFFKISSTVSNEKASLINFSFCIRTLSDEFGSVENWSIIKLTFSLVFGEEETKDSFKDFILSEST